MCLNNEMRPLYGSHCLACVQSLGGLKSRGEGIKCQYIHIFTASLNESLGLLISVVECC